TPGETPPRRPETTRGTSFTSRASRRAYAVMVRSKSPRRTAITATAPVRHSMPETLIPGPRPVLQSDEAQAHGRSRELDSDASGMTAVMPAHDELHDRQRGRCLRSPPLPTREVYRARSSSYR